MQTTFDTETDQREPTFFGKTAAQIPTVVIFVNAAGRINDDDIDKIIWRK